MYETPSSATIPSAAERAIGVAGLTVGRAAHDCSAADIAVSPDFRAFCDAPMLKEILSVARTFMIPARSTFFYSVQE
jgi:hypothetical protein